MRLPICCRRKRPAARHRLHGRAAGSEPRGLRQNPTADAMVLRTREDCVLSRGTPMTATSASNLDLAAALAEAEQHYRAANPKSLTQHRLACAAMPGGNTRASIHVDPFPLTIVRGEGARLVDLDGHEYTDFLSEFTAGIYGHSHPSIRRAIEEALAGGINFGAVSEIEARFAAALCARFPSLELVRFTNSGTEANLMALSAANAPFDYLVGRYNDLAAIEALVRPHRHELAAILVEPMQGTTGCIPAERPFLAGLRELADETGAVLIFDEVMTSRLAPGGLQEALGILPDLTTLGKYLGGGMSFGAFGGRGELMARFDPRRKDAFQHAGTFNNNLLTMNAGYVGLTEVYTPPRARALNQWGEDLRERLNAIARRTGLAMQFTGRGSMMSVHMTDRPIRSEEDAARGNAGLRDLFWFDLLAAGIWFAKRGMFALSIALDEADADQLATAVEEFAALRAPLFAQAAAV